MSGYLRVLPLLLAMAQMSAACGGASRSTAAVPANPVGTGGDVHESEGADVGNWDVQRESADAQTIVGNSDRYAICGVVLTDRAPVRIHEWSRGHHVVRRDGKKERKRTPWNMAAEWDLSAERRAGRIYLRQENFTGWGGELAPLNRARIFLQPLVPIIIVTDEGEFLDVARGEKAREAAELLVRERGLPSGSRHGWSQSTSDYGLAKTIEAFWLTLAGAACADLRHQSKRMWETQRDDPDLEGANVVVKHFAEAVGTFPCADTQCAKLVYVTQPDPAVMQKQLEGSMSAQGNQRIRVEHHSLTQRAELWVELRTRYVHKLHVTRVIKTKLEEASDGRITTHFDKSEQTFTFKR